MTGDLSKLEIFLQGFLGERSFK